MAGGFVPAVPASRLGPAIVWLRDRGVSADRLASLLGTTPLNIRQIDFRERRRPADGSREPRDTLAALGVRLEEDASGSSASRDIRINALRQRIAAIRSSHLADGQYLKAARLLKQLHQYRGFPSSLEWLRVVADLHREQAWFLVHSGRTFEALQQATLAIASAKHVYLHARRKTPADAKAIIDAALIRAHAHLMRREPEPALTALQLVEDASDAAGLPVGSDYHRQRGIVLLQAGVDEAAIRYFRKSGQRMTELGEGSHPLSEAITNSRYVCLLKGNVDAARELAEQAHKAFGQSSMEASVSANWAAACALSVNAAGAEATAQDLHSLHVDSGRQFGHQATLALLLGLTPHLGLPLLQRQTWIRHALYLNAASDR